MSRQLFRLLLRVGGPAALQISKFVMVLFVVEVLLLADCIWYAFDEALYNFIFPKLIDEEVAYLDEQTAHILVQLDFLINSDLFKGWPSEQQEKVLMLRDHAQHLNDLAALFQEELEEIYSVPSLNDNPPGWIMLALATRREVCWVLFVLVGWWTIRRQLSKLLTRNSKTTISS